MTSFFSPDGSLNVAQDSSDLVETGDGRNSSSGEMVRCKNLRTNERGKAITRDGSSKINSTAIETAIWWIEEQDGDRYTFAGTKIYRNESSIDTGLTSAQWSAIQYNAFNDTTKNVFALNGTDRKRISGSTSNEWGIAAPTTAPTLTVGGGGAGLSGRYNAKYTYCRKVGGTLVAESNGSDAAATALELSNESLVVSVDESPSDSQITHVRLYRTLAGGSEYFLDKELDVSGTYDYGYMFDWEESNSHISGTGYKFTVSDSTNNTENTHTWEETYNVQEDQAEPIADDYSISSSSDYVIYWDPN